MRIKKNHGQAITEYIIVASVVSIAFLGLMKFGKAMISSWINLVISVFTIPIL